MVPDATKSVDGSPPRPNQATAITRYMAEHHHHRGGHRGAAVRCDRPEQAGEHAVAAEREQQPGRAHRARQRAAERADRGPDRDHVARPTPPT